MFSETPNTSQAEEYSADFELPDFSSATPQQSPWGRTKHSLGASSSQSRLEQTESSKDSFAEAGETRSSGISDDPGVDFGDFVIKQEVAQHGGDNLGDFNLSGDFEGQQPYPTFPIPGSSDSSVQVLNMDYWP